MCLCLHESVSDRVSSSRRRKEETRACVLVSPLCAAKRKHELGSAASASQSSFTFPRSSRRRFGEALPLAAVGPPAHR